jgi:hypothetical protein
MHCFNVKLAVHTVTVVFYMANYCVKGAVGGPSIGRGSKGSCCVRLRRWYSKQIHNCMIISTISAEMLKLTNL